MPYTVAKTKARSPALLFGGEKRLENARFCGLVHPYSGICNRHNHVPSQRAVRMRSEVISSQLRICRLYGQLTAGRHCISSVQNQIHHHLVELNWVGLNIPKVRVQNNHQLDILPDGAPQQFFEFGYALIDVEYLRLQNLLPPESKELSGQACGPFASAAYLQRPLPDLLQSGRPLNYHPAVDVTA